MNFLFKLIPWFIGLTFIAIISIWIITAIVAYKSLDYVNEKGLKSAIEQVWCGKESNCSLPGDKSK